MRRLIRHSNKYPPKVRGQIGKITKKDHEFFGRYMWQIEVFCIPASGKITILKTIQSLGQDDDQSFVDEHKAKQHLRNMIDKVEAALEKVTKKTNRSGLISLPGGLG